MQGRYTSRCLDTSKDQHLNQTKLLEGLWVHWSHRMIKELIKRTVFYDEDPEASNHQKDRVPYGNCFPLWYYPK